MEDPDLTDVGWRQAQCLAEAFGDGRLPRPTALYVSPLRRTIQTALPTADRLDLPLRVMVGLHEVYGDLESRLGEPTPYPGASVGELRALTPRVVMPPEVTETGWYHGDYETPAESNARAITVAQWLNRTYIDTDDDTTDETVALVTHGWFSQFLLRAIIGWPLEDVNNVRVWFELRNTATVMLELGRERRRQTITWTDRVDHLPPDLVTS